MYKKFENIAVKILTGICLWAFMMVIIYRFTTIAQGLISLTLFDILSLPILICGIYVLIKHS